MKAHRRLSCSSSLGFQSSTAAVSNGLRSFSLSTRQLRHHRPLCHARSNAPEELCRSMSLRTAALMTVHRQCSSFTSHTSSTGHSTNSKSTSSGDYTPFGTLRVAGWGSTHAASDDTRPDGGSDEPALHDAANGDFTDHKAGSSSFPSTSSSFSASSASALAYQGNPVSWEREEGENMHRNHSMGEAPSASGRNGGDENTALPYGLQADEGDFENGESPAAREQRRRRALYVSAVELHNAVQAEVRAEVARDSQDGAAAVPPLAPRGWAVRHTPGASFFTMSRSLYPSQHRGASGPRGLEELSNDNDDNSSSSVPRYRSVHDTQLAAQQTRKSGLRHRRLQSDSSSSPPSEAASTAEKSQTDGVARLPSSALNEEADGSGKGPVWTLHKGRYHRGTDEAPPSGPRTAATVVRSDVHVTVFAPFRVQDLSFYDPTVSICEWSCFDVLVQKSAPAMSPQPTKQQQQQQQKHMLIGQQRIWDQRESLLLRLASVNSELRVRSVQLLSTSTAVALRDYAVFGKGEPLFLELLRRQRAITQRRLQSTSRRQLQRKQRYRGCVSVGVDDTAYDEPLTAASSLSSIREGSDEHVNAAVTLATSAGGAGRGSRVRRLSDPIAAASTAPLRMDDEALGEFLCGSFDAVGDVARSLCYAGPYVTELSKELRDALLTYVMSDLGVSAELVEYVCQMQYFLEQEEYMRWLARLGHVASAVQRSV